jgi:hypothetical protein
MTERSFTFCVVMWLVIGTALVVGSLQYIPADWRNPVHATWIAAVFGSGIWGGLIRLLQMRLQEQKIRPRLERGIRYEPLVGALVAVGVYLAFATKQITIFSPDDLEVRGGPDFSRCVLLGIVAGYLWELLLARLTEQVKGQAPTQATV